MSQAHRIKQIIKKLNTLKTKILFELILILFFKTCLLVKTSLSLVFDCVTNALARPPIALESCSSAQTDRTVY